MKPDFLEVPTNKQLAERRDNILTLQSRKAEAAEALECPKNNILLASENHQLHLDLRRFANAVGRIVVRVERTAGVLPIVRAVKPAAVLLDLDLPNQGSWEIADSLSSEKGGPPMVLFTGRTGQTNVETAIGTGAVLDLSAGACRLIEAVDEVVGMSDSSRVRWNANQLELVRWLSPGRWSGPVTSARRFWGIND